MFWLVVFQMILPLEPFGAVRALERSIIVVMTFLVPRHVSMRNELVADITLFLGRPTLGKDIVGFVRGVLVPSHVLLQEELLANITLLPVYGGV